MTRIDIMVSRHAAFYSPLIATIAGGFLEGEGLDPTYAVATPETSVLDAIAEGSVHLAQSAVSASWGALERGEASDIVHFAQINERDGFFITGRDSDADFTWDKLVGRQVLADHGGQPFAMFRYGLHRQGVDIETLELVDAGGVDAIDAAFRAGRGDYVHQQGPLPQQLERDGVGHVVAAVGEAVGAVAFSSLCAARHWLDSDMARAFMRAYRRARRWVNETPAADIAAAEADFFPGVDREALAAAVAAYQGLGCWNPDSEIPRAAYEVALDVFLHSGMISARHAYDDVVTAPPDTET